MTQLYIEGYEIVLPDDFSLTTIEENPIITKAGDFSMDIDFSLLEKTNAKALGFINRLNIKLLKKDYKAQLIINNDVKDGLFIVLSKTNISVKGQFVAGNSELNYLGADKKIWDFDWGTEDISNINNVIPSMYYPGYGQHITVDRGTFFSNYVCPPVKAGDVIINNYQLLGQADNYAINWNFLDVDASLPLPVNDFYTLETAVAAINTSLSGQKKSYLKIKFKIDDTTVESYIFKSLNISEWSDLTKWIAIENKIFIQPYLLYYVNKLPELLGYTLGTNELNADQRAKIEYMVNTVYSDKYADFLPDITVNEFITYVENKFHVTFKADSKRKVIDILFLKNEIGARPTKKLTKVFDSFDSEPNTDNQESTLISKSFEYDIETNDYFKYMKLSEDILEKCEIIEFANFTQLYDYIKVRSGLGDKKIIYRDLQFNRDYFVRKYRDGLLPKIGFYNHPFRGAINGRTSGYDICLINKFKDIGDGKNSKIEIAISPSAILRDSITHTYATSGSFTRDAHYQLPYIENNYYIPENKGFIDTVEKGDSQFRNSKLSVAMYTGIIKMYDAIRPTVLYPFSHIDIFSEFDCQLDYPTDTWYQTHFVPAATKSLVLQSIYDDYAYTGINSNEKYKFTTPEKVDVKYIYHYEGADYIPISIERKSNEKIITGYFYRLK